MFAITEAFFLCKMSGWLFIFKDKKNRALNKKGRVQPGLFLTMLDLQKYI